MDWKPHKNGHLAKSEYAYYHISRQFDQEFGSNRWLIEYQNIGADHFGQEGIPIIALGEETHGYDSLEAAKAEAEKIAREDESCLEEKT